MTSFILYSHSYMQDWPAEQGSIDLCATSEYPNKKDVLKNIVHAMGCAPGSQDEVETYENWIGKSITKFYTICLIRVKKEHLQRKPIFLINSSIMRKERKGWNFSMCLRVMQPKKSIG